jgi:hypothetical protein
VSAAQFVRALTWLPRADQQGGCVAERKSQSLQSQLRHGIDMKNA